MLTILNNTVTEIELYKYFLSVSNLFVPNLCNVVDIKDYANKVFRNALIIESWDNSTLIGVMACYANNHTTKEAFITSVSVMQEYQGKGICKSMFKVLYSILLSMRFKNVSLEVSKNNKKALMLYYSENFKYKFENTNSYILTREI